MMANSFIDKLFPELALRDPHLGPTFDPKLVLGVDKGSAFDHWKGKGTSAEEWKPKLSETPHGTTPLSSPVPTGVEPIVLAKDDSRFSGDADTVVVTGIKEIIGSINYCIAEGNYNEAINCSYTLRGLVCGYADFKCGVICALKDSKK